MPLPSTVSRRTVVAGLTIATVTTAAGCLSGDSVTARCSSYSDGFSGEVLLHVKPLRGRERISLGILVAADAPTNDDLTAIAVRNRDGAVRADIPLRDNRDMSGLGPDVSPAFDDGELYAVPLGPPPQHGVVTVEIVDVDDAVVASATHQFNCYSPDGELP